MQRSGTLSPHLEKVGGHGDRNVSSTYYTRVTKSIRVLHTLQFFSRASFIFLSTPFPVQFIKMCPTVSVSPQQSHRQLLCNFICCSQAFRRHTYNNENCAVFFFMYPMYTKGGGGPKKLFSLAEIVPPTSKPWRLPWLHGMYARVLRQHRYAQHKTRPIVTV